MRFIHTLVSVAILGSVHSFAASLDAAVDLAAREANPEPQLLGDHLDVEARDQPWKVSLPNGWQTVSDCATDGGNQRVFPAKQAKALSTQRHVLLDNSPATCASRCAANGYGYAAVRMGVECWCSRQQPKISNKNKNQCTYPCPGNPKLTCGSFATSQVYVNWSVANRRAPRVSQPRLANGWSVAFNCLVDPTVGEVFLKNTDIFELANNTPLTCTKFCGQKGYDLAGVEYSNECMCGTGWKGPARPNSRPKSECYMACTGDNTLTCGAGHRVQLFKHSSFKRHNATIAREFDDQTY